MLQSTSSRLPYSNYTSNLIFYKIYAIIQHMVRVSFDFDDPNPGYKIIQASGELDTRVTGYDENGSAIYGNLSKDNLLPRGVSNVEAQYITDTDALAGIFTGDVKKSKHFLFEEARYPDEPVTHAVYLDKSARNVNNIIHELWSPLTGRQPEEIPEASFLNIDKKTYLVAMGLSRRDDDEGYQNPDIDKISLDRLHPKFRKNVTQQIRALYLYPEDLDKIDENDLSDVWNYPTVLDGQRVAIVDETRSSSATLRIADMLLREAFPDAHIEPVTWSVPGLFRWNTTNEDGLVEDHFAAYYVPVWYDENSSEGRGGIDDIAPEILAKSSEKAERIGRYVLSAMRREMDITSRELLDDFALLAKRFKDGYIPYRPDPSSYGEREDVRKRIEEFYGIPHRDVLPYLRGEMSPEEFKRLLARSRA